MNSDSDDEKTSVLMNVPNPAKDTALVLKGVESDPVVTNNRYKMSKYTKDSVDRPGFITSLPDKIEDGQGTPESKRNQALAILP